MIWILICSFWVNYLIQLGSSTCLYIDNLLTTFWERNEFSFSEFHLFACKSHFQMNMYLPHSHCTVRDCIHQRATGPPRTVTNPHIVSLIGRYQVAPVYRYNNLWLFLQCWREAEHSGGALEPLCSGLLFAWTLIPEVFGVGLQ